MGTIFWNLVLCYSCKSLGSYCGNNIVVNEICKLVLGFDVIIVNPRAL